MTSIFLREQSSAYAIQRPEIRPGYTVRVHERIKEGDKERIQIFEGLVISIHKGSVAGDSTITVRRIASGVGVEKVFSLHSPKIEKIEVKKVAKVRRAKLFFLRGRRGKAARLSERFTTADEFAIAASVVSEENEINEDNEDNENNEINEDNENNEINEDNEINEKDEVNKESKESKKAKESEEKAKDM